MAGAKKPPMPPKKGDKQTPLKKGGKPMPPQFGKKKGY